MYSLTRSIETRGIKFSTMIRHHFHGLLVYVFWLNANIWPVGYCGTEWSLLSIVTQPISGDYRLTCLYPVHKSITAWLDVAWL